MNKNQRKALLVIVAAAVVYFMLIRKPPEPPPPPPSPTAASVAPVVETQTVLYARKAIPRQTRFDTVKKVDEFVYEKKGQPKDQVPKGRVAEHPKQLLRLVALEEIARNEPIILDRFARPEEIGGVSYHIPDGKRAVTLRIDKIRGVGGFITQDDVVDIIGSFTVEGRALTKYVLQKVKILAVNQIYTATPTQSEGGPSPSPAPAPGPSPAPSPGGPPRDRITGQDVQFVTFELTPSDAEKLIVASENARLYLVLRNPSDTDTPSLDPVDAVDVYTDRQKRPPVPKFDVDILKGSSRAAVGVRVESVALSQMSTGTQKQVYYEPAEPVARDFKKDDFKAPVK
ncbi:MAG: Flp pilus assembly protein CpaB [Candidatus Riflebacteria bacterium]|nr:Flp pilus assembly protein CpaB [Candidatus Riflebacteria bacterium]